MRVPTKGFCVKALNRSRGCSRTPVRGICVSGPFGVKLARIAGTRCRLFYPRRGSLHNGGNFSDRSSRTIIFMACRSTITFYS